MFFIIGAHRIEAWDSDDPNMSVMLLMPLLPVSSPDLVLTKTSVRFAACWLGLGVAKQGMEPSWRKASIVYIFFVDFPHGAPHGMSWISWALAEFESPDSPWANGFLPLLLKMDTPAKRRDRFSLQLSLRWDWPRRCPPWRHAWHPESGIVWSRQWCRSGRLQRWMPPEEGWGVAWLRGLVQVWHVNADQGLQFSHFKMVPVMESHYIICFFCHLHYSYPFMMTADNHWGQAPSTTTGRFTWVTPQ